MTNKIIEINNKKFPSRIHEGANPQFVFITHHGILSNKSSWIYFEKWIGDRAIVVSYDARLNGDNNFLKASRRATTYVNDLKDVVFWVNKKWPNLKIVLLGSSWGATIILGLTKRNPELIYKSIAWSLPMRVIANSTDDNRKKNIEKIKLNKTSGVKETTKFEYFYKFLLMILFNANTKSYTNIDLENITGNKLIQRIQQGSDVNVKKTPTKLFYAAYKLIVLSLTWFKKINQNSINKLLYIQSTNDTYVRQSKLEIIRKNNGKGIKYIELNRGVHAFQWETKDNLHHEVFSFLWDFVNE